jgi:hypothetical protein
MKILILQVMRLQSAMKKQNEVKLFEDKKVRTAWYDKQEQWYFSILSELQITRPSACVICPELILA